MTANIHKKKLQTKFRPYKYRVLAEDCAARAKLQNKIGPNCRTESVQTTERNRSKLPNG